MTRLTPLLFVAIAVVGPAARLWAAPTIGDSGHCVQPIWGVADNPQHPDLPSLLTGAVDPSLPVDGSTDFRFPAFGEGAAASGAPILPSHPELPVSGASSQGIARLAGPPAAALLMLQGIACIAFFRGRRKWLALLVAALALGRDGLCALPRLVGVHRTAREPGGSPPADSARLVALNSAVPAQVPERDFLGLLRRLDSGSASAGGRFQTFERVRGMEAAGAAKSGMAAYTVLLTAIVEDSPMAVPAALSAVVPLGSSPLFLPPALPFALFARPPPIAA
jgi:hypothetical protein